ncbi:MASE1 domain-containing protein [Serratia sp. AKBS12]|uniref:MASE1 domain-containing protein n=1 Tax=Serratia sp. AKBS12 TaxID=2974597 RepID=UPI00216576CE|nr:MASE1 domain-containing protein [Serratia sp. AKBS12]MCS3408213.1 MASE1 domain-containing protein [Serratia sp. AKBS12]
MDAGRTSFRYGLLHWLIFIAVYFLLATISLATRDPWSLSSAVWLPAGLLLGILCIRQPAQWPMWVISAGVMHFSVSLLHDRPVDIALAFALADPLILCPLALIWNSMHRYANDLSYRGETLLLLGSVYLGSAVGGLISDLLLKALGYPIVVSHFVIWSISNATGCLAIAPLFIIHRLNRGRWLTRQQAYTAAWVLPLVAAIFCLPANLLHHALLNHALLYMALTLSLLLAALWPLLPLALYFILLTLLVSLATLYGYGPFAATLSGIRAVEASQLYLLVIISLGLLIATREQQHRTLSQQGQQRLQLLGSLLQARQPTFFCLTPGAESLDWQPHKAIFGIPPRQLANLTLLLAHVHPDDRESLANLLRHPAASAQPVQCCALRLLLPDAAYHQIECRLLAHPQHGISGVLALVTAN